jgi:hypothetical protein
MAVALLSILRSLQAPRSPWRHDRGTRGASSPFPDRRGSNTVLDGSRSTAFNCHFDVSFAKRLLIVMINDTASEGRTVVDQ